MNLHTTHSTQHPTDPHAHNIPRGRGKTKPRHPPTGQQVPTQLADNTTPKPNTPETISNKAPTLRVSPSARSRLNRELNHRHNPLRLTKATQSGSQRDAKSRQEVALNTARELGENVVLSHTSAWLAHGYPVPFELLDDTVYIFVPKGNLRIRRLDVQCMRRSSPAETTSIAGVRVTTPAQTWLDIGHLKPSLATYTSMADRLVGRSDQKLAHLQRFVSGASTCKGIRLARMALPLVRNGAESIKETETRLRILTAGLPEPELNQNIYDRAGRLVGRADMVYRTEKVIVEYDGAHHGSDATRRRDAERRNALQQDSWRVLTVTQSSFDDPDQRWLQQLAQLLRV